MLIDAALGSSVSVEEMLRSHLQVAIMQRAGIGGAYADCEISHVNILVSFSEPTAIQANKLNTVKKCLNEVLKHGGPFNARDLYPVCRFPPFMPPSRCLSTLYDLCEFQLTMFR